MKIKRWLNDITVSPNIVEPGPLQVLSMFRIILLWHYFLTKYYMNIFSVTFLTFFWPACRFNRFWDSPVMRNIDNTWNGPTHRNHSGMYCIASISRTHFMPCDLNVIEFPIHGLPHSKMHTVIKCHSLQTTLTILACTISTVMQYPWFNPLQNTFIKRHTSFPVFQ